MVDIDFEDEVLTKVQASSAATVARVALGDNDEEYEVDLDNLVGRNINKACMLLEITLHVTISMYCGQ